MTELTDQEKIDIFMRSLPDLNTVTVTRQELVSVLQSANLDEFSIQFITYELGFK